ncbi:4-hydroxy-tetrahydrodipicolinate synthase [Paenibacillus thermotolerans]|uniref:4-hydroxy-tetrahydrodipicolinate synthase n=1 Tax=Paenibacillus thermotolerans TaxID=3027807 RepID=UPI002367FCE2|nr:MULTISPECIES: 4-hydroxy-tetrahydrodipicolinate synthase [unclassified Paenibacillus]
MDFGRLVTAMVTPFDDKLRIDWEKTANLVEYLIEEQQSDSLVVAGTTGESPTLSDDEKLELFRFVMRQARGRAKIIAGTGSNDTAHSVHLTKEAEKAGVDAVLLVSPYYSRTSQDGLIAHFGAIAEATSVPVMLYNIPSRTGVNIEPNTLLTLMRQHSNITAVKESSGDLDQMSQIIAGLPEGTLLYSGDDNLTLPVLSIGGHGVVSVASHVIGREMKQMIEAYTGGRPADAAKLHGKLMPVFKGLFYCPHRVPNPVPVKHALKVKGVDCGGVRLPLVTVTEQEAEFIEDLLK